MPTFRLDKIVRFEQRPGHAGANAGDFESYSLPWQTVFDEWAQIKPLQAGERVEANKLHGESTHQVIVRNSMREITPQMRMTCYGEVFNIIAVKDWDGRGEYWEILVKRGEPDAR